MTLIKYDLSGTFAASDGVSESDIAGLESELSAARQEVLETDLKQLADGNVPTEKDPLDAAFFELPEKILAAYSEKRGESELGRILATTSRVREAVDRVVVLGIGGSYMGARALMEACCHPYHNELSRGDRGSRPQMYFEGNNVDNDASQGLIDLLNTPDGEDWSIVVISKSGGTLETAVSFRQFLRVLTDSCGKDRLGQLVVPVTGASGKLFDLAQAIGCEDIFQVPDGVGGRFSILSPVGLTPAAMLGLDVVRLLEGAAAMNEHFRTAAYGENIVQQFVASNYLMYEKKNCNLRIMSAWSKSLEAVGLWYDQLMAESLGKHERGATPLTVVNTRDLHSRAQQHQEGARDKYMLNLIADSWRRDPLPVGTQEWDQDQLNQLGDQTLPDIMTAAIKGTNKAYLDDNRPTASIHLPKIDEFYLGQLFQMLMIATVVEGRLMGINPYGQPGVEAYKVNMKAELGI